MGMGRNAVRIDLGWGGHKIQLCVRPLDSELYAFKQETSKSENDESEFDKEMARLWVI